jgi:hypothetical protein
METEKCRKVNLIRQSHLTNLLGGMRHTSTALYFYGASEKTLHKPRVTFGNMLLKISYSPNYNLQFLFQQFLSKTYTHF